MLERANPVSWTALALLLAAPPAGGPSLRYRPAEGRTLERTFREATTFQVDSIVERIGETELPDPLPELRLELQRELEVVDTALRIGAGRADALRRRFVTVASAVRLRAEQEGRVERYEADLESPLEGATVAFAWDEDEEGFRARFEDDPEDAAELAPGLREDLDLRALLPPGDVEQGGRWTVGAEALAELLAPGGELALRFGYEPDGDFRFVSVEELTALSLTALGDQRGELEGELEAEWTATGGEEGARLATVELTLEATLEVAGDDALSLRLARSGIESERLEPQLRTSWTIEGRGRLVWDLDAGVFRELTLELEHECRAEFTWTREFAGQELYYGLELEMSGETTLSAECR